MHKRLVWSFFVVFSVMGFVCDQSFPPVIQNNIGQPLEMSGAFSNGRSFSGQLPPGGRVWSPEKGLRLTRLEVASEGKVLFRLGDDDLERLQANTAPGQKILWAIERDGIRALPLEQ